MTPAQWFASNSKYVLLGVIALLLVLILFAFNKCAESGKDRAVAVQAEQTTKSGEAIAEAAQVAVETVDNRASVETTIDIATTIATREIDNAESSEDVRAAVTRAVCERVRASGRTDPACIVQQVNPR